MTDPDEAPSEGVAGSVTDALSDSERQELADSIAHLSGPEAWDEERLEPALIPVTRHVPRLLAEVERLRDENTLLRVDVANATPDHDALADEAIKAHEENDRLRAELAAHVERESADVDRLLKLLPHATRFTFGDAGPYAHPHAAIDAAADVDENDETAIHVVARPGLDRQAAGVTRWSINCGGWVRTHAGRWVNEPIPGERTEKFMRATRWPDAASAITVAEQLIAAGHPNLPEWQTGRRYPTREEDLDG
jgi:hypothetical protein